MPGRAGLHRLTKRKVDQTCIHCITPVIKQLTQWRWLFSAACLLSIDCIECLIHKYACSANMIRVKWKFLGKRSIKRQVLADHEQRTHKCKQGQQIGRNPLPIEYYIGLKYTYKGDKGDKPFPEGLHHVVTVSVCTRFVLVVLECINSMWSNKLGVAQHFLTITYS